MREFTTRDRSGFTVFVMGTQKRSIHVKQESRDDYLEEVIIDQKASKY